MPCAITSCFDCRFHSPHCDCLPTYSTDSYIIQYKQQKCSQMSLLRAVRSDHILVCEFRSPLLKAPGIQYLMTIMLVFFQLLFFTYPLVVRTWEGSGSTCGSLCHNHHRTTAGPGTEENIHINRCYHVGTALEIKAEDTRALIEGVE